MNHCSWLRHCKCVYPRAENQSAVDTVGGSEANEANDRQPATANILPPLMKGRLDIWMKEEMASKKIQAHAGISAAEAFYVSFSG